MKAKNSKSGFTIIEVVLVLAIAGLIFLMVFIALPALQRSQRDTQRRDDLAMLSTAINNYSTNNRGRVPDTELKWKSFWTTYLKSDAYGSNPSGDNANVVNPTPKTDASEFVDPLGSNYIFTYKNNVVDADTNDTWDWSTTTVAANTAPVDDVTGFVIHIYARGTCNGETVGSADSARSIAYRYRLEGAGYYCNQNK